MKKHVGPFIKLLLLLAFLSRLEFVFGQGDKAIILPPTSKAQQPGNEKPVRSPEVNFGRASSLGEGIGVERLELKASPNVFNSRTDLSFTLRQSGRYKLEILNMQGNVLSVLAEGEGQEGEHFVYQLKKEKLNAGAYIGRLVTAHEITSARFIIK
ncbi:hypothetical protein ABID22_000576 [Pontibacter aydingkolensis]|uniref:T9SS type A sorting domain-containing protein n=1 Tax=Pontibacter aydingkolensis TaxID=1911536 RepID=A0ABS7CRS2_9BACT|nr:T9SS type A sorting domain-containing protein [Pontibacter aydingkolensis]MBW7466544.1 T9SS type A sorting domain-containing protein [Pontibacter aydingkolensis]